MARKGEVHLTTTEGECSSAPPLLTCSTALYCHVRFLGHRVTNKQTDTIKQSPAVAPAQIQAVHPSYMSARFSVFCASLMMKSTWGVSES